MQLNIRVVLVGLEIWNVQNPISTDGGAGEVLSRFTQWREKELVPRRRHDSAQLILSVWDDGGEDRDRMMTNGDGVDLVPGKRVLEQQQGWPSSPLSALEAMGAGSIRYEASFSLLIG